MYIYTPPNDMTQKKHCHTLQIALNAQRSTTCYVVR